MHQGLNHEVCEKCKQTLPSSSDCCSCSAPTLRHCCHRRCAADCKCSGVSSGKSSSDVEHVEANSSSWTDMKQRTRLHSPSGNVRSNLLDPTSYVLREGMALYQNNSNMGCALQRQDSTSDQCGSNSSETPTECDGNGNVSNTNNSSAYDMSRLVGSDSPQHLQSSPCSQSRATTVCVSPEERHITPVENSESVVRGHANNGAARIGETGRLSDMALPSPHSEANRLSNGTHTSCHVEVDRLSDGTHASHHSEVNRLSDNTHTSHNSEANRFSNDTPASKHSEIERLSDMTNDAHNSEVNRLSDEIHTSHLSEMNRLSDDTHTSHHSEANRLSDGTNTSHHSEVNRLSDNTHTSPPSNVDRLSEATHARRNSVPHSPPDDGRDFGAGWWGRTNTNNSSAPGAKSKKRNTSAPPSETRKKVRNNDNRFGSGWWVGRLDQPSGGNKSSKGKTTERRESLSPRKTAEHSTVSERKGREKTSLVTADGGDGEKPVLDVVPYQAKADPGVIGEFLQQAAVFKRDILDFESEHGRTVCMALSSVPGLWRAKLGGSCCSLLVQVIAPSLLHKKAVLVRDIRGHSTTVILSFLTPSGQLPGLGSGSSKFIFLRSVNWCEIGSGKLGIKMEDKENVLVSN